MVTRAPQNMKTAPMPMSTPKTTPGIAMQPQNVRLWPRTMSLQAAQPATWISRKATSA